MADDYGRMMRRVQPAGPYHVLGWSLGGSLAALVAARLEAQGQSVAFVGLVDPFVPVPVPVPAAGQVEADDWWRDFSRFVAYLLPGVAIESLADLAAAAEPGVDTLARALDREVRRQGATRLDGFASMDGEALAQVFMVARHLKQLSLQAGELMPLTCAADAWLIHGRDPADQARLLRQLAQEGATCSAVAADHFSIMRDEGFLAELLARVRPAVG